MSIMFECDDETYQWLVNKFPESCFELENDRIIQDGTNLVIVISSDKSEEKPSEEIIYDDMDKQGYSTATCYIVDVTHQNGYHVIYYDIEDAPEKPIVGYDAREWISATKTRNYALKDTLHDWLDYWHSGSTQPRDGTGRMNLVRITSREALTDSTERGFMGYLMQQGHGFEDRVVAMIRTMVLPTEFVTICESMENFNYRVLEYEKSTIDAINKGIPFIYQAVLLNRIGKLRGSYGIPDLLVRSDYLKYISEFNSYSNMETHKAPMLQGRYHYVVVDIKYTTLDLCVDGIRIRNSNSIPAYKCQLCIYNQALGEIQGYRPGSAFILGRRYRYESKNQTYVLRDCFSRLGRIEYDDWDREYIVRTRDAISWYRRMKKDGGSWTLYPAPSVPELYPNMASVQDSIWNEFKTDYAKRIGEITLLWHCGVRHRMAAHQNGIFSYTDDTCTSETMGIGGEVRGPVIDKIIGVNRKRKFDDKMDYVLININPNADNRWMRYDKLMITIDFETIGGMFDDFQKLPQANDKNFLYMIGIAYRVGENKDISYKMFLASELSYDAEFQLILQMYNFLRTLTDVHLGKRCQIPALYHWGSMESKYFGTVCKRVNAALGEDVHRDVGRIQARLKWYDMCASFRDNPIVINGCYKFGLKEISNRLVELGLITTRWANTSCSNGNTAMLLANRTYSQAIRDGMSVTSYPIMREIMEYNKIDCIIIHDIVSMLRDKMKTTSTPRAKRRCIRKN